MPASKTVICLAGLDVRQKRWLPAAFAVFRAWLRLTKQKRFYCPAARGQGGDSYTMPHHSMLDKNPAQLAHKNVPAPYRSTANSTGSTGDTGPCARERAAAACMHARSLARMHARTNRDRDTALKPGGFVGQTKYPSAIPPLPLASTAGCFLAG